MPDPPFEPGVKFMVAWPLPATATGAVGAPGTIVVIVSENAALSKKSPVENVSSASIVNVAVVAVVGVPEITPVEVAKERPGGKEPLASAKLTAPWVEVAASV